MKRIIFCIPYAGGSANIYRKMQLYMTPSVSIVPIELAGRGARIKEPFYNTFQEAVNDVTNYILKRCCNTDSISILGYSMGSLIAYEATLQLEKKIKIDKLIVSSNDAPSFTVQLPEIYQYSDEDLFSVLQELGNAEQSIFNNKRFWNIYSSVIKADFRLLYQYRLIPRYEKVNTDITVFVGNEDKCYKNIREWANNTNGECIVMVREGGHFSMLENLETFAKDISAIVLESKRAV